MKKLLVVLLSLGLLVAFGATASAADVKFGGSYYVGGVYDDNPNLLGSQTFKAAYFYTRTRLEPVFKIAEGLNFTVRLDVLEKSWGNTNWKSNTAVNSDTTSSRTNPGGTQKIQENIEWERAYVTFKTAVGQFDVGYQTAATWGTQFADAGTSKPRIKFATKAGPVTLLAIYEAAFDSDSSNVPGYRNKNDADNDNYYLAAVAGFKGGQAGLLYGFIFNNATRLAATPYTTQQHLLAPYVQATFGPVYVEAEVNYWFGKAAKFDGVAGATDTSKDGWSAYLLAKANLGPAYFGGMAAWSAGDSDPTDSTDKNGGGGGTDWNPALILMSYELDTWSAYQYRDVSNSSKANFLMYKVFGGVNPMKQLNLELALISASKDQSLANEVSKNMGLEVDVTASYKIYDNLTYMVGAGYLWTGDYYKGTNSANTVGNNYVLMNKLSLSF